MRTVNFDYDVADHVDIVNTSVKGIITMCGVDAGGVMYLVRTESKDGALSTRWLYPSEITPIL